MRDVIVNTSPLQYLFQADVLDLLPALYGRVTVPMAVVAELAEGRERGLALPDPAALAWVDIATWPGVMPRCSAGSGYTRGGAPARRRSTLTGVPPELQQRPLRPGRGCANGSSCTAFTDAPCACPTGGCTSIFTACSC